MHISYLDSLASAQSIGRDDAIDMLANYVAEGYAPNPTDVDTWPAPDLSGQWADGRTPRSLALECGWTEGDFSFWPNAPELLSELCEAYENAFYAAVREEIEQMATDY